MRTLGLLLLLPFSTFSFAADHSIARTLYVEEVEYQIHEIIDKHSSGENTEYDDFRLDKLSNRIAQMTDNVASRVVFTYSIEDKEPVERLLEVTHRNGNIFLFTEVIGQKDKQVTHIWYSDGIETFRKTFHVCADKWRMWSSKHPDDANHLTVLVYSDNTLIAAKHLEIQ